ncbi:MAG: SDR family NAD(P)-dependent oxidoreductase, partial [Actinomycetota bacterium]
MSTHRQRVVLVTGAAGGIGAATARTLAAEGAAVIVHDVRLDGRLGALADELGAAGHALAADLRDPAAADAL